MDNEGRHLSEAVFKFKTTFCIQFKIKKKKKELILLGLIFINFPNRGVLSAAPCTSIMP
jgi:hypothetical protein